MRIVRKTAIDMIPKAITLYVIKELRDYIENKLLVDFLCLSNDDYVSNLMKNIEFMNNENKLIFNVLRQISLH